MYDATEYSKSLRDLADWVEAHPDIELPNDSISIYSRNTKEEAVEVLKALTPCKKDYSDDLFTISRSFGRVLLRFIFYRNVVCTRRVVGTQEVPEKFTLEKYTPSELIPAHTEEIVEWDCDPILAEKKETT